MLYLAEHGRQAMLPDVRHQIQTSRHYPDMSEVRVAMVINADRYVVRVLTCFADADQSIVVCVGGNKASYERRTGRNWYDDYVPVADQIVDQYTAARR